MLDALDDQLPLQDFFIEKHGFKYLYEFAATSVDLGYEFSLLGHSNPSMAVLEINTGTCGTTSGALAALQSVEGICLYSRYTFASQSPDILTEARENFGSLREFHTVSLKPTSRTSDQGFASESYDLVIIPSVSGPGVSILLPRIDHFICRTSLRISHRRLFQAIYNLCLFQAVGY